jgi:hypothetical protein
LNVKAAVSECIGTLSFQYRGRQSLRREPASLSVRGFQHLPFPADEGLGVGAMDNVFTPLVYKGWDYGRGE